MNERKPEPEPERSVEAERTVLGAMFRDQRLVSEAASMLQMEDFYLDAHQKLYRAMIDLWDKNEPVELASVGQVLVDRGQVKDMGEDVGLSYLWELWEANPGAEFHYYAKVVRDKATLRRLQNLAFDITRAVSRAEGQADEALAGVHRLVMAATGVIDEAAPVGDLVRQVYERIDERSDRRRRGLTIGAATGFCELDSLTNGLQDAHLVVAAARPGVGKTAWALCVASNVAIGQDAPVLFFSCEMKRIDLVERLLCCHAEVNNQRVLRGQVEPDESARLCAAGSKLADKNLFISEASGFKMLQVAAIARRQRLRTGVRLVVVDYLQLVEADDRRENRQEQVAGISRRLKALAMELNAPVLALSQLNREVESRPDPTPRIADLRESGAIEQDADVVLLMHRPRDDSGRDLDEVHVNLAKNRNGPQGKFSLRFVKEFMRFENKVPV